MSDQTLQRTHRIVLTPATLPWLVAAGIYALLMLLGPKLLGDPDTYSHIAMGRWMLAHLTVPDGDPLSLTMRGEHWIAFEWLSQIAYATALSLGGWTGVVTLAALSASAAFGLLTHFLLRHWQPTPTIIAVLAAFVLVSPHILARPHVLALPLIIAWVAALIRTVDEQRAPPWHMLPLMILWANLHGSFTFGIAIAGGIACDALWNAPASERFRVARQWFLFGVLAIAAASINPYGPEAILVTTRTIALGEVLTIVTEWRSQDFTHLGAFEVIMLGAFGFAVYRGVKLPPMRILLTFGILHLSLSQSRHADLLGLLTPMLLARPLAEQFAALAAERGMKRTMARVSAWAPAAAVAVLIAVTGAVAAVKTVAPAANITPAQALASIDTAKNGRILNAYDFGGYLDFAGIPAFIDGRAELYGMKFIMRHSRALDLQNLPDFLAMLDEYKFSTTLLTPSTPAVALLDRLPEWKRVYADDIAVVHVRR
jgi:hypothetical protein